MNPVTTRQEWRGRVQCLLDTGCGRHRLPGPGQLYGRIGDGIAICACWSRPSGPPPQRHGAGQWVPGTQRIAHLFSGPIGPWGSNGRDGRPQNPGRQRFCECHQRRIVRSPPGGWALPSTPSHIDRATYAAGGNWGGHIPTQTVRRSTHAGAVLRQSPPQVVVSSKR